jgi:hypothetical protein
LATLDWTVLHHFSYSPDLALSDFHLLGFLKDALRGRRFAKEDELKHSVRENLRRFNKGVYATDTRHLIHGLNKCVDNDDFMEK